MKKATKKRGKQVYFGDFISSSIYFLFFTLAIGFRKNSNL